MERSKRRFAANSFELPWLGEKVLHFLRMQDYCLGLGKTVRLADVTTGSVMTHLNCVAGPNAVAFSPDGRKIAAGMFGGEICLWDIGEALRSTHAQAERGSVAGADIKPLTLLGHTGDGNVYTLAFSPDGKTLASGGQDHNILIWDVATGEQKGAP